MFLSIFHQFLYCPEVFINTLLPMFILLSLSVHPPRFPTHCLFLKAYCQDLVISYTMPVQQGLFAVMAQPFENVNVECPPMVNIL